MSKSIARKSLAVLMALVLACWQLPAYSFADETGEAVAPTEEAPAVVDDKPALAESETPAESEPASADDATGEGEQGQPVEDEQPTEPQTGEEGADAEAADAEAEGNAAADEGAEAEAADVAEGGDAVKPGKAAKKNTQKTFTAEVDGVQVTATLAKPSTLPEGVEFTVTRVTAGSGYNYDAYMEALNGGADEPTYTDENTMLFDVAFIDKSGVEVQPGKVDLAFSFSNHQLTDDLAAESASDVEVMHLPLADAVLKNVDTTAQATDISAADVKVEGVNVNVNLASASESVRFTLGSLSVVALGAPQDVTLQEQADGDGIQFTKHLYGEGAGTFEFALQGLGGFDDAQSPESLAAMIPASLEADASAAGDAIIDQNTCADLQMVSSISMDAAGEQGGSFPGLNYSEAGEYYFVVGELAGDVSGIVYDDQIRYVAHVNVSSELVASEPDYLMFYPDASGGYDSLGAADAIEFCNNGSLNMEFMAIGMAYYEDDAARVRVYPEVEKTVNEGVDLLKDGEFSFQLFDSQGTLLREATNDEIGNVAFYDEKTDTGLVFEEEGTFTYTINEVIPQGTHPDSETGKPKLGDVTYDDSVVTMKVDVTKDEGGALKAAVTYTDASGKVIAGTDANGAKLSEDLQTIPTFKNYRDTDQEGTVDLKVRKVSRADGKPLADCTYALWMKGVAGDAMIAEATSGDDGYIIFEDVHLMPGQKYYYKEVSAPEGHTIDPHRTAYFELDDSGKLVVTEEVAEDGWHSRYE